MSFSRPPICLAQPLLIVYSASTYSSPACHQPHSYFPSLPLSLLPSCVPPSIHFSSIENWSCRTESNLPMAAYCWPKPDVRSNLAQSKKRYLVLYLSRKYMRGDSAAKGNNELYAAQYHRPVFDARRRGKKARSPCGDKHGRHVPEWVGCRIAFFVTSDLRYD